VLITVIVLAIVAVLGAGGLTAAYLLTRNHDGTGKTSATAAAQAFLEAVYTAQDPKQAAPLVCSAARDSKKLQNKIDEIKRQNKQYDDPKYTWTTLNTESTGKDRAVLSTTVTLTTANVQKATQKLNLTVIKSTGWFVCDVKQA
jgi:type II secretory pathway pseudopilin PulG